MPPMGTAPRLRQTATSRRKMLARNGVVLMSTPKRSGQTDLGSAMTNSKMLAFRSQRAALSPAAYGPERVEHLLHLRRPRAATRRGGSPRIVASFRNGRCRAARVEEVAVPGALLGALDLGQVEVDALPAARPGRAPGSRASARCPGCAAGTGSPSTVTSGSSRCRPRSRCMKNGSSPGAMLYSRFRSRSTNVSSRFTAARRLWQARTVSISRWPAESSSSSRSPSARSPSGPG